MAETIEPQTPEEDAALRELAATHRRRHRWFALFWSLTVSAHATIVLHTIWDGWPRASSGPGRLACFVVNALSGGGWLEWSLRGLREREALDRQWKVEDMRWRARDRAWRELWGGARGM